MASRSVCNDVGLIALLKLEGLSASRIKALCFRVGQMPILEIEGKLALTTKSEPNRGSDPVSRFSSALARVKRESGLRTNGELVRVISDELEERGFIASAAALRLNVRETMEHWLNRVAGSVGVERLLIVLDETADDFCSGARLARIR